MTFPPINDAMLNAFEGDCAVFDENVAASSIGRVLMKYLGQTIARVRRAEKQRDDLVAAGEAAILAMRDMHASILAGTPTLLDRGAFDAITNAVAAGKAQ